MAKDKALAANGFSQIAQELLQVGVYKRSQGRVTRQSTCIAVWVALAIAAWRMYSVGGFHGSMRYALPTLLLVVGAWMAYRMVNYPPFADFLIAVEAEMNKVTWPSWTELTRSSMVVIVLIFGLTIVLFGYDSIWSALLQAIGVVRY
jgi:preprotein translocase subunit SecE